MALNIMHSYLISSLGNCAHKTPTETDVINVLEPVNFALLTAGSKCSAEASIEETWNHI